jgi:hypothetical protein
MELLQPSTPLMVQDRSMDLPPLPDATILLVEVGSTAHGTGIPGGEDYDQLGVVVEMPHQVLGLDDRGFRTVMQRTQPEGVRSGPGDVDRTLHSLRRFVRLAASGNPSILMALWAPVDHAMHCARLGFQCQELLTTGQLHLPVQGEPAEWLRAVRRGEIGFDEWWTTVLRLDEELAALERDERYRHHPDQSRIERWAITTHQRVWRQLARDESA